MHSGNSRLSLILSCLYSLLIIVSLSAAMQVKASDLPPRPTDGFPPRPTDGFPPRPSPVPTTWSPGEVTLFSEAYIELNVLSAHADLWTVVQWQDHLGIWHDVEGWQGTLDEIENDKGKKTWWIGKAAMGTGPFRWLVYQSVQGKLLVKSAPFDLPSLIGQTVKVEVSPSP